MAVGLVHDDVENILTKQLHKQAKMSSDEEDEGVMVSTPEPRPSAQTSPSEIVATTTAWASVARSFIYVEVASLVLMFSTLGVWNTGDPYKAYALSVSVISLALCLIIQTGEFVQPGFLDKTEKGVSLFLFLWWGIGTGIITFKSPFTRTSNGYFSAWAGFLFATREYSWLHDMCPSSTFQSAI